MQQDQPPQDPVFAARLAQVRARDRNADGHFVYAVRSTGVYCRPSCPARPAKTGNISFHATPDDAEAAGFRACLRCRPRAAQSGVAGAGDSRAGQMRDVAAYLTAHATETVTLADLAERTGLSPFHLQRSFKAALGVSPREYHAAARLRAFKAGLRQGIGVLEATFDAGYGSTSRVYEQVDGGLGMTPSAYRAGGAGETIAHATRRTALGLLMMAATARGVCFVQFGESDAELLAQLEVEFPKANLVLAGPDAAAPLDAWMTALDDHLSRSAPRPDLPLDLRGTAFQVNVWHFLLTVPPGAVVSYSELAQGVGAPRAIRAAASACAANRLAVLVPCHRALRADGGLGGYRWGIARKQALLAHERGETGGISGHAL